MSGRIAGALVALALAVVGLAFTLGVTLGHLVSAARRSGGLSGMG